MLPVDRTNQTAYAGAGARFYLTRRFFLRADYRRHTVFTSRDDNEEIDRMETRLRVLLLRALAAGARRLRVAALAVVEGPQVAEATRATAAADDADAGAAERDRPQVARRKIKVPKIDAENIEVGAYYGALSIEDFGTAMSAARTDYHVTEDFFFEANAAAPRPARPASRPRRQRPAAYGR